MKPVNADEIRNILKNHRASDINKKTANAVLVPLVETENGICLLFEVRSGAITQGGDVCFPGGKVDDNESPRNAALRECREELGIDSVYIDIIAPLDYISNHAVKIYPFAAFISREALEKIVINTDEVEEFFLMPLGWLLSNKPCVFEAETGYINLDSFPYRQYGIDENYKWRHTKSKIYIWPPYKGHVLWGLSAGITHSLLKLFK